MTSPTGAGTNGSGTGPNGTFPTPALTANATYRVTCTGTGGVTAYDEVDITVTAGGCTTTETGTPGAITLSAISGIPSRTTGVAPLAVFFDATGSAATATTRPFHDLEYRWDFGDKTGVVLNLSPPVTGTSTWNAGSNPGVNSRNEATGAVAAHVYETPGTYTVRLDVTDGTNTVTNQCIQITAQNPDDVMGGAIGVFTGANTICVRETNPPPDGTGWEGCPAGATHVVQPNFTSAIGSSANPAAGYAKTGKRVLFRRGDTFTVTSPGARIIQTGPGIVGAFGTGALPVIQAAPTFNGAILQLSTNTTPNSTADLKDWRVMDLNLVGAGLGNGNAVSMTGGMNQVTLLRLAARNQWTAFSASPQGLDYLNANGYPGHTIWDQLAIVDSTVSRDPAIGVNKIGNQAMIGADRLFFAGNLFDSGGTATSLSASHVTRFTYLGKAVISNNSIQNPGPGQANVKLHGPYWCYTNVATCNPATDLPPTGVEGNGIGGGYSRWIVFSDNKVVASANSWMVVVGPQSIYHDERVRDVVLERNRYVAGAGVAVVNLVVQSATEITSRNEIWDAGPYNAKGVYIRREGTISILPTDIRVYNSSYYSSYANDTVIPIRIEAATASNVTVKNNLAYAPFSSAAPMINCQAASGGTADCNTVPGFVQSNNSTDTPGGGQIKTTSPFAVTPPVQLSDWAPTGYAIGGGTPLPVWSDFFGNSRPASGVPGIDMGAFEP
ncbi:MAG: hypothetical protein HZC43_00275 [Nitrosomonadales bacterium]|nr:hypothetical protein [Nitrosomonadales bacterium]